MFSSKLSKVTLQFPKRLKDEVALAFFTSLSLPLAPHQSHTHTPTLTRRSPLLYLTEVVTGYLKYHWAPSR